MKKLNYYEDYLQAAKLREEFLIKKNQENRLFQTSLFIFTVILFSAFFLKTNLANPLISKIIGPVSSTSEIEKLNTRILALEEENRILKHSTTSATSLDILSERISKIEEKNSYLYSTILSDANTAITPKIIRAEQDAINDRVEKLSKETETVSGYIFTFIILLAVAILGYIAKDAIEAWRAKNKIIKE